MFQFVLNAPLEDHKGSNVNEVIRAVLNFIFFYEKIWHAPKAQKHKYATEQKHKTLQANKNKKCA